MGIRNFYAKGVDNYYIEEGDSYENRHLQTILEFIKIDLDSFRNKRVLDLCCGNGEITNLLKPYVLSIEGSDPYLRDKYVKNTNEICYDKTFHDMSIDKFEKEYDIIICSFALHLCDKSMLPNVLWNLSQSAKELIIITPNKNPKIDNHWTMGSEVVEDRVRYRKYHVGM